MAFEDPTPSPDDGSNVERSEAFARPRTEQAEREPGWVLAVGIFLYLVFLTLSWYSNFAGPVTSTPKTAGARMQTYMAELLVAYEARSDLPAPVRGYLGRCSGLLATSAARAWERIGSGHGDAGDRALALVDAAGLYRAADCPQDAQRTLMRAMRMDPKDADIYRELLPLHAASPHPVVLSSRAESTIARLSAGPLIQAQNARLRQDAKAAVTALQVGARAGARVVIANLLLGLLFVGLLIAAVIIAIMDRREIGNAIADAERTPPTPLPWGIGMALIVISGTYLLSQVVVAFFVRIFGIREGAGLLVLSSTSIIITAVVLLGLLLVREGRVPWDWSPFGWVRTNRGLTYGVVALVLSLPLVWIASIISSMLFGGASGTNPLIPSLEESRSVLLQIFLILTAVVMAPLVEETLFRGLLFRSLDVRLPFWSAAILSGFIFAIGHGLLGSILPITILGAIFALLTRHTRSLLAAAAAHGAFNGYVTLNVLLLAWALRGPGA